MTDTTPIQPVQPVQPVELPTSLRDWLALLDRLGVRPSKGLGQHFLFERGVVDRIVRAAGVSATDLVLEIGPGLGILTAALLRAAGQVVAVELDRRLAEHLRVAVGPRHDFTLVEGNALETPIDTLIPGQQEYAVVANLPYAVGAAVLRHLLEQPHRPRRLTVMLQREVAERLTATPPNLSILGVSVQFFATARIAFLVPPGVFIPPPSVESAIVVLDVVTAPPLPQDLHPRFFRIVNAGFRHKRKKLANSLSDELDLERPEIDAWLAAADVSPDRRAQTLAVADWVRLAATAPPLEPWR